MDELEKIKQSINETSDENIWSVFAYTKNKLKEKGLVRTNNITGERGEFLAIATYNNTAGMPNLQAAPEGTQNVDALSRKGERYSIKTITLPGSTTGVFYGIGSPEDAMPPERKFEYIIIVRLDPNYQLHQMIEITWENFLKFKRWHTTMRAWNLSVTEELLKNSKIVFNASNAITR